MKSCRLRLGLGFKRGCRLPPSRRSSAVGAVWSWPRPPPIDYKKLKIKETRSRQEAGLRIVQFHRITCSAQVAPWPGVLIPPPGQILPAILPGGRAAVKDRLPQKSDARRPQTLSPVSPSFRLDHRLRGEVNPHEGVAPVLVNHQPDPRLQLWAHPFVPNRYSAVTIPSLGPPSRVSCS